MNVAEVRKSIDQRIRQLQRQAVPVEPTEGSLRRQLRAQQPGRQIDHEHEGVAGAQGCLSSVGHVWSCRVASTRAPVVLLDLRCQSRCWCLGDGSGASFCASGSTRRSRGAHTFRTGAHAASAGPWRQQISRHSQREEGDRSQLQSLSSEHLRADRTTIGIGKGGGGC